MLRRVHEPDPMLRLSQQRRPARLCVQYAALALLAQLHRQTTMLVYQADQTLRLMRIELVADEDPLCRWVAGDSALDMGHKVGLVARWPQRAADQFARGYFQVGDQAQGAMAYVLELAMLHSSRLHGNVGRGALQSLHAGHLIAAHQMDALFMQLLRLGIQVTDFRDLFHKLAGVIDLRMQPVTRQMGLDSGLI